jgi:hypothetical protein
MRSPPSDWRVLRVDAPHLFEFKWCIDAERWKAVHPPYVRDCGPPASTIGPPVTHADYLESDT